MVLPVALAGMTALRAAGSAHSRLAAWISGTDAAVLAALMQLDRLTAWHAVARVALADLSGRTPHLLVDLFAEDALLEDPIWGKYRGRDAILQFMTTMVKEMGERKIHFTVDEICGDEHACWARWTMHSPAGSRTGVGIYKVVDGKLSYYRDYMDPPLGE